jgi:CRP/FNR family transcriptional regulator, nitrogen fixation regulation protein
MLHWQGAERTGKVVHLGSVRRHAAPGSMTDVFDVMGAYMTFERNAEIFGDEEPAEYVYKLVSGAVRSSKLMSDGRRQIGAFYLPGDIFGMEGDDLHRFSAEAIGDCGILVVKRSALVGRAAHDTEMVTQLWTATMAHLQRAQDHMLLLGRKSAQERIATFLLDMAGRLSKQGAVELPMSRQDIADYLGLTIETVSRTLTHLERQGVISMPVSRRIVLRDRAALDEMHDCLAA